MKDTWSRLSVVVSVLICVTAPSYGTFYEPPTCPPTGQQVYPNDNCQLYYLCDDGMLKVLSCPLGQLFDRLFLHCRPAFLVNCVFVPLPTQPQNTTISPTIATPTSPMAPLRPTSQTTPTSTSTQHNTYTPASPTPTKPTTTTPKPTTLPTTPKPPVICPSRGTQLFPTGDCVTYFNCTNGKYVIDKCPSGDLLDPDTVQCKPFYDVTCYPGTTNPPTPPTTTTTPAVCPPKGTAIVPTGDCVTYYNCTNGKYAIDSCPPGDLLDPATQECKPFFSVSCYPVTTQPPTTTAPALCPPTGSKLVPTGDCVTYYNCTNGKYAIDSCPPGDLVDPTSGQCEPFFSVTCYPVSTTTAMTTTRPPVVCPSNGIQNFPTGDCVSYYHCTNGKYAVQNCPSGDLFDPNANQCQPFYQVSCVPQTIKESVQFSTSALSTTTTKTTTATTSTTPITASNFPAPTSQTVTTSQYPSTTKKPVTPTASASTYACPPTGHASYPTGDCISYYDCNDGNFTTKKCPFGESFDPGRSSCVLFLLYSCTPATTTLPPPSTSANADDDDQVVACPPSGILTFPAKNCRSYNHCSNGQLSTKSCSWGRRFDPWLRKCLPSALVKCSEDSAS